MTHRRCLEARNLWLHTQIRPPVDPAALPDDAIRRVQGALNTFRAQLGIPTTTARPGPLPDVIDEAFAGSRRRR